MSNPNDFDADSFARIHQQVSAPTGYGDTQYTGTYFPQQSMEPFTHQEDIPRGPVLTETKGKPKPHDIAKGPMVSNVKGHPQQPPPKPRSIAPVNYPAGYPGGYPPTHPQQPGPLAGGYSHSPPYPAQGPSPYHHHPPTHSGAYGAYPPQSSGYYPQRSATLPATLPSKLPPFGAPLGGYGQGPPPPPPSGYAHPVGGYPASSYPPASGHNPAGGYNPPGGYPPNGGYPPGGGYAQPPYPPPAMDNPTFSGEHVPGVGGFVVPTSRP